MRLLYINNSPYIGGAETSLHLMLKYYLLHKSNIDITVILPKKGAFSNVLEKYEVKIHYMDFPNPKNPFSLFRYTQQLVRYIKQETFDIIHANTIRSSLDSVCAARFLGIPIVGHIRDLRPLGYKGKVVLNLLTLVLANSKSTKRFLINQGIKPQNIKVIYNGVDLEEFNPIIDKTSFRKKYGIQNNETLIGFFGQLHAGKGVKYFLESAKEVESRNKEVKFLIVGDDLLNHGAYRVKMENLARKLGIDERTIFTGFLPDVREAMAAADIHVLPSLMESFGRVVIEGMAMGKPIIATAVGGVPEIVVDGKTGFLVPAKNSSIVSQKILYLIDNFKIIKEMGRRGRRRVEKFFSLKKNAEHTLLIYRDLIEGNNENRI